MLEVVQVVAVDFVDLTKHKELLEDVLAHPDGEGFSEANSRSIWEQVRRGYDDADKCKDKAYLIPRDIHGNPEGITRYDCNTPTTVDRVSLDFKLVCWLELVQAYALLLEDDIDTDHHIIIQGLCMGGGGRHFAMR